METHWTEREASDRQVAKRRENGAMITFERSHRGKMMITLQRPHRGPYRGAVAGSDLFGGVSNKSKANADIGTCVGQLWVARSEDHHK